MSRPAILFISAVLLASIHGAETVHPPRDPAYQLVWSDEFNTDGPPDPAKWKSEHGFARNEELQWYQAENSKCQGGLLVIEARRETVPNPRHDPRSRDWRRKRPEALYTSGSLITTAAYDWHFGRAEIRARFKALPGLWPAIWTTGHGRWPHAGEIDIMEYYQGKILANFVWAGKGGKDLWNTGSHPIAKFSTEPWEHRFHLWVAEWDREKISIYLDGQLLNTQLIADAVNQDGPPVQPFLGPQQFRLNLAIGSNGGDPASTSFPQRYEIDHIRIYRKP